jgi:hypothetical protein
MRTPHFILAALVALATFLSLSAVVRRGHSGWQSRFGPYAGAARPFGTRWGSNPNCPGGPGTIAPPALTPRLQNQPASAGPEPLPTPNDRSFGPR